MRDFYKTHENKKEITQGHIFINCLEINQIHTGHFKIKHRNFAWLDNTNQVHNFSIKHFFVHPKKSKQLVGNNVWFLTVSTFILFNNEFLITGSLQKMNF